MQGLIESYCHVGIVHGMAFPQVQGGEGPILETLGKIAVDPFFSAVEVGWIKDAKVRAEAAELMTAAGLDVIAAAAPRLLREGLSLSDPSAAGRQRAVDLCKRCVDEAYELGASIMAVLSGPDPGEADRGSATEGLVDSLKQLCADAQQKAGETMLAISLENFDRTVDKKLLIGPTREAAEVARAVYSEYSNVGLTIDLSHQPLLRENVHDMVLAAIDYLIHVHVGNCVVADSSHPAYGDRHPRFGVRGGANGVEELKRFLEALIYAGYFRRSTPTIRPVVSFEVQPLGEETSELVIANAKRTLLQAWARL